MVIAGSVIKIFTIDQIWFNFIDTIERMFYNLNHRIKKRGAGTMATENQIECMKVDEEEVAGDRDYIELLNLFKTLKEEDKQKINSLIKSLLSVP